VSNLLSSKAKRGFASCPARFSGKIVFRIQSTTRSVWAWRATRKGDAPSPSCLFFPSTSNKDLVTLMDACQSLHLPTTLKYAGECALWASGTLGSNANRPVVKVRLATGQRAKLVALSVRVAQAARQ